jgi:hypothetical protein
MKTFIIAVATALSAGFAQAGNTIPGNQSLPVISAKPVVQDFGYFRVHRMGRDASLNWSVTDPAAVSYFVIERSYDGSYFEVIDEVSSTGNATHKYRDGGCFPGFIYYRIQSHQSDGSVTTSPVEMVHIVAKRG